ncbi:MAG TPA: hypothetical protein VJ783_15580 [Pirellulales bacterium]|nr:hypothetical protein [Pirellulales bacterium]
MPAATGAAGARSGRGTVFGAPHLGQATVAPTLRCPTLSVRRHCVQ